MGLANTAYDSCTEGDGTAFGDTKPNTPPFPHVPDLGFGGWIVDSGSANYKIQSNKAEQQAGHSGGAGGKYCANDISHDEFIYFADIVPALDGTGAGLGFRANENPEDGTPGDYWEQKGDAFSVEMDGWPIRDGLVTITLLKRVGGTKAGVTLVTDVPAPHRMVLVVNGSNLDVYREPIGGGTRTAVALGVDLTQSLAGSTDPFNDTDHMRFTLESASNLDIGTTFDEITVQTQHPPTAPGAFIVPVSGEMYRGRLVVKWGAAISVGDDPIQYEGEYSDNEGATWSSLFSLQHRRSYTWDISGLTEGILYQVRARAYDGAYSEEWVTSGTFTISAPDCTA